MEDTKYIIRNGDDLGKLRTTTILDLLGTHSAIGQLLGRGVLLDKLDGAQDGLWDWWGSGQKVGLGVEAVLVGGVDNLDRNALGGDVAVGAASVVPSLSLLLELDAAGLLDVEGVGAVGVLVGQELGDGVIVEGGGQGASQESGDEELSVKVQGS